MKRAKRLALIAGLGLAILPGTWLRDPPGRQTPHFAVVPMEYSAARSGPFVLAGAWQLAGGDRRLGGFSGLVRTGNARFLAISDSGRFARFTVPASGSGRGILREPVERALAKYGADMESVTREPASGIVWTAYENANRVVRLSRDLVPQSDARPPRMRHWGSNSGPESLVRLDDGRFLTIEESARGRGGVTHRMLVFDSDPAEAGAAGREGHVATLDGYRIVDAALWRDTIWLLLRDVRWGLPPSFDTAIARFPANALATAGAKADTNTDIEPELVARLTGMPRDNYEGLAIEARGDGSARFWLIADDNFTAFQANWLLALDYDP